MEPAQTLRSVLQQLLTFMNHLKHVKMGVVGEPVILSSFLHFLFLSVLLTPYPPSEPCMIYIYIYIILGVLHLISFMVNVTIPNLG